MKKRYALQAPPGKVYHFSRVVVIMQQKLYNINTLQYLTYYIRICLESEQEVSLLD
jgi:hypothetical protein